MNSRINDASNQQDTPALYIKKLETEEYVARIHKGEIEPEQERPISFPSELISIIQRLERTAKNTGKLPPVKTQIDRARKNPAFEAIYQGTDKKHEKKEDRTNPEVKSNEPIVPPLPKDVALPPEASAGACKWHDRYVEFSKLRSPRSFQGFHEANGWALLSTVAKRRIALDDLGAPKFTPLFIAVVARSSIASKTEAARVFIAVLDRADLKWMLGPDEMTPQAMIDHMKEVNFVKVEEMPEDDTELKRKLAFAGQLGWFYEEFGEHIESICAKNSIMAPFKGIIRRMDDCHDEYRRETMSHKEQVVSDPYLSLLACMTPLDLKPYAGIDSPFWTNGFFARFAFNVPDTEEENNARFPKGNLYDAVPNELINPLKDWHKQLGQRTIEFEDVYEPNKKGEDELKGYRVIHGELPRATCELSDEAMDAFYRYGDTLKAIIKREKLEHFEGNYIRFPMMAMRIAMLCASLENDGKIEKNHWAKGQEFSEQARQGLHYLWIELNKNSFAQERDRLEEEIIKYVTAQEKWITSRIMRRNRFYECDLKIFDDTLERLIKAGDLISRREGKMLGYSIPGEEKRSWPNKNAKAEGEK